MGLGCQTSKSFGSSGHAASSQHQKGQRGVLRLQDQTRKKDKLFNQLVLHPKTNHKLVRTHSAPFWVLGQTTGDLDSLDSPRLGLGGSHHLPPYNILCSFAQRLHPNGSFSQDSQSEVPKLSRFGLPGLWAFITSRPELGSG